MKLAARTRAGTWIAFGAACIARRRWPATVRNVTIFLAATAGVAHGAADDTLVADRVFAGRFVKPLVAVGYAAVAASTFALGYRAPKYVTPLLTALTWYHFGAGDAAFAGACRDEPPSRASWTVRGAIPVATSSPLRVVTTVVALYDAYRASRRHRFGDAVDLALPALSFFLARDQQTFLAYFTLWHAPRHIALVLERYGAGGATGERVRRFVVAALPNALAALLAGIPMLVLGPNERVRAARAFVVGITVPHLIAVAWLEHRSA